MIKKLTAYILALMSLAACSDDLNVPSGTIDSDGNLHLSFSVAPLRTVSTRATENLNSVTMFAYCSEADTLLQKTDVMMDGLSGKVLLTANTKKDKDAKFYFVANMPSVFTGSYDSSSALAGLLADVVEFNDALVMSSGENKLLSGGNSTIELVHNAAKITVTNAVLNPHKDEAGNEFYGQDYIPGSTVYKFITAGTATQSSVLAGGLKKFGDYVTPTNLNGIELTTKDKYVHPTVNTGSSSMKSYVIVEAEYSDNKTYYYRLDFQKKATVGGETTATAIDIASNHWYQFLITDVTGPGSSTPAEAAKNPTPMVEYAVYDRAPVIYNMISDGMRELGVTNVKTRTENASGEETIYVKLYSKNPDEESELKNLTEEQLKNYFQPADKWLTVKQASVADNTEDIWGNGVPDDNTKGTIYAVTLKFNETNNPGDLETTLRVNWCGLSRDVQVNWLRKFNALDLFNPDVQIKAFEESADNTSWNGTNKWTENTAPYNYFTEFLTVEEGSGKSPLSIGTSSQANGNVARDNGLHFPMPYGNGTKWTYMYKLTLKTGLAGNDYTWSVRSLGISDILFGKDDNHNLTASSLEDNTAGNDEASRTFYITRKSSADDFKYESGVLIIDISPKDKTQGESASYTIRLFHTGFFHKDNDTSASDNGNDTVTEDDESKKTYDSGDKKYVNTDMSPMTDKFNYYEVVQIGSNYWLDRNIGATSSNDYILDGTGDVNSRGYYMAAGFYCKYSSPFIFKNSVPDGYSVPSTEQWNNLKTSSSFVSELSGAYYTSYNRFSYTRTSYSEKDGEARETVEKLVYLPKSRYYSNQDLKGESRAGYYWTKDASSGTEKDEIGNWLRCFTLSGSSTSYINGKVMGKDNDYYYMSMRAVYSGKTDNINTVSFWVEGATHVYVYQESHDSEGRITRTAETTWPGKAIGTSFTVKQGVQINYQYMTSENPNNLYVIFNYVDSKGKIYTMSKDSYGSGNLTHYNINPNDAQGWRVIGASSGEFNPNTYGVTINGSSTQNGTYWTCHPVYENIPDYTYTKKNFENGDQIRIEWNGNYTHIHIWYNGGDGGTQTGDYPGKSIGWDGTHNYYEFQHRGGNVTSIGYKLNYGNGLNAGHNNTFTFSQAIPENGKYVIRLGTKTDNEHNY